jgi:hypothetical protein
MVIKFARIGATLFRGATSGLKSRGTKLIKNSTKNEVYNYTQTQIKNNMELDRLQVSVQNDLIEALQDTLEFEDINFTEDLSKSIHPAGQFGERKITIDSPYASLVDKGTPPGTDVDVEKLSKWVSGKLGIDDNEENKLVTIKIKNKIENGGIQPTFFVKKAIKRVTALRGITKVKHVTRNVHAHKSMIRAARMARKVNSKTAKLARIGRLLS